MSQKSKPLIEGNSTDTEITWLEVKSNRIYTLTRSGRRVVWLREFGEVKLFRTRLKDQLRHYFLFGESIADLGG